MVVCDGVFMGFQCGRGFVGFSGQDRRVKDLVVVVVTRSAWLWVCESDLVVGGDGFTNRFWSWVWG